MPKSVISYDRDLPEIAGRCPWLKPASYLVKDASAPSGWREDTAGRRPSKLLLVKKLRAAVDAWRDGGYPGASDVTRRLFEHWFEEDHEVAGFPVPFRFHFCQREAIETLAYMVEVAGLRDTRELVDAFAEVFKVDLYSQSIEIETTIDGRRQIRRYVPELERDGVQDLPPENLRRYAFKMATGSGKTWVMAMAIVWAYFHKRRVAGSELSTNFLMVAPNVVVYQRLERDFTSNKLFHEIPLIPPEWKAAWTLKPILRGDSTEPDPSGNLFLTNVQQLYETRQQTWTPQNAVDALLGRKPSKDLASYDRTMLDRLKSLHDLVVLNDEAHHVHDADLAWSQSLLSIDRALPKGLALWLDFSATPRDQQGMAFPWTLTDYPLAQAVEDRIVKAPIIVSKEDDPEQPDHDPDGVTKENICDRYGYWLAAAVARWKEHDRTYGKLGTKPVLFVMVEKNVYADAIGRHLWQTSHFGFTEAEVLVIHTDEKGEITKKELDEARQAARDIDAATSQIKVIVSVMMLREGWDVKNVSVVLGLRPYSATAEILPEQVVGRGLRLMTGIGVDGTQTLEVLGTRNLLNFLREKLEAEGVGVAVAKSDPPRPVIIEAMRDRAAYDINVPLTKPRLSHSARRLSTLDATSFDPIYETHELDEIDRINLKFEFATTQTEVHQDDIAISTLPIVQELLGTIAKQVMHRAGLTNVFNDLLPIVRTYLRTRCFGRIVDLDDENIRSHLNRAAMREGIAKFLARKVGELVVEKTTIKFENAGFMLSETRPFSWRRNLPPLTCKHTVFNHVATYNDFERRFAQFLDEAPDVLRFASLGTTQQGESNTQFRVDYLKRSGAIGFYYPDWVVVQIGEAREVFWIIETKGRVWDETTSKDAAIDDWCDGISQQTGQPWRYKRVNQSEFDARKPTTLADALAASRKAQQPLL